MTTKENIQEAPPLPIPSEKKEKHIDGPKGSEDYLTVNVKKLEQKICKAYMDKAQKDIREILFRINQDPEKLNKLLEPVPDLQLNHFEARYILSMMTILLSEGKSQMDDLLTMGVLRQKIISNIQ